MASPDTESDLPKVSGANTKKEILEAYGTLKKRLKEQAKASLEPEKEIQAKAKAAVVREAEAVASEDVVQRVKVFQREIETTLDQLARKLSEEAERYRRVQQAVDAKKAELQEIFEIETGAHSLAALLEAQKQKRAEFEAEMEQIRTRWEAEKRRHEEAFKEKKAAGEKQWEREREEYDYRFEREKDLKTQALTDQLAALERELQQKREAFERESADKEEALLQRDIAVAEREKHMSDLEKRVLAFPEETEKAVQKAVGDAVQRMKEDAARSEALLVKGFEGERNVLSARIEALESTVEGQRRQIDTLTRQLDAAYAKVQDIAVKAVSTERSSPSSHSSRDPRE